jgi:hypothetical protein
VSAMKEVLTVLQTKDSDYLPFNPYDDRIHTTDKHHTKWFIFDTDWE